MTFIPVPTPIRPARQDILLVGDCMPKNIYTNNNKPFTSAGQGVLQECLHMAGLTGSSINVLNLVPDRVDTRGLWINHNLPHKRAITQEGLAYVKILIESIERLQPKVIMPLGPFPTHAILGRSDYTNIRGYPFEVDGRIVIPTNHPEDMIWSNYIWRYYTSMDLKRAKEFAEGTLKIVHPDIVIPRDFMEAVKILETLYRIEKPISIDIEVSNFQVSCIGFCASPNIAFSIPFDQRWSEEEEVQLWRLVAQLSERETIEKIFQNGIFDIYFLLYVMGIYTRGHREDTMIAHSIAYPDFLKGLGFLGSVYTTYTYWKDQGGYKSIKKEN